MSKNQQFKRSNPNGGNEGYNNDKYKGFKRFKEGNNCNRGKSSLNHKVRYR